MADVTEIRANADNLLVGHGKPQSVSEKLQDVLASLDGSEKPDMYGQGAFMQAFEAEVAGMFGKTSAVFMPSGTMAQQIALRIWCERSNNQSVAMHPTAHLETAEHGGMHFLHHLDRLQFGVPEFVSERVLTRDDFENLGARPGAVLLELPYRPIGGQLPTWSELEEIANWCRENNIPLHLDGARIWSCTQFYGKSLAEIAVLFDSIYVSFYKDLGGIAGCMLMGSEDFIAESRVWQRRHGGNLPDQSVLVAAAKMGLQTHLPAIDDWVTRARELAAILSEVDGVIVNPNPPHVNFFQLYLRGDPQLLVDRHNELAAEEGSFLFGGLRQSQVPGYATTEVHVFSNGLSFDLKRLQPFLTKLLSG